MNYYITTSIPYLNGDPHIGFGLELLQADILARYARQQGHDVIFSTGTDEHGSKIADKAAELNMTPKQLVDEKSQAFRDLGGLINASNNRFIRTTDPGHEQRAALIWKALEPHIYKKQYSGLYCRGCEAFVSEKIAKENNNTCPNHQKQYELVEEENYFFKLSAFNEQIKKAIESNEFSILPVTKRNEILFVINEGLEDISISRPATSVTWGIPVPGDDTQVMYVWFEALMNYITVLGYPEHDDFKKYWPASVQVIGKDIIRFHGAIWPGMLLALGLELPKVLYVHGFIDVEGQKISKSLGNVIHPKEIIDKYNVDTFRYFFARHISSQTDGEFAWQKLHDSYNSELANELGNTVQRTAAMITQYQDGVIGDTPAAGHDSGAYHEALRECKFDRALDEVWLQIRGLNQYIDETKPWQIKKQGDDEHLKEVLAYQVSCLLQIASLLEPFLPGTAQKIQEVFASGLVVPLEHPLFPRMKE
mgnify:CR=1 FL=1